MTNMTTETKATHTPGAIRAAEAITGWKYGVADMIQTNFGRKTTEDIADLIDRETAAPDLLTVCKELMKLVDDGVLVRDTSRDGDPAWAVKTLPLVMALQRTQAAIAKAEGER